jgi:hypothetical protein
MGIIHGTAGAVIGDLGIVLLLAAAVAFLWISAATRR